MEKILFRLTIQIKLILILACVATASTVSYDKLNGSDLGMGIGARAISMGGAFVSISGDATGIYWNPAGLADLPDSRIAVSMDLPQSFSSATILCKPEWFNLDRYHLAVGLSYIYRLRFIGDSGQDQWDRYSSQLLDLSMIEIESDFHGRVDSKTIDKRISLSFKWPGFSRFNFGLNLIQVD